MVKIFPYCSIRGENLNSENIEELSSLKMKKNIKKGKIVAYSISAKDILEYNEDYFEYILLFIEHIQRNKKVLQKLNYDKIILDLEVDYLYQCNLEFDKNILGEIYKTFDDLFISCYEFSENEFENT